MLKEMKNIPVDSVFFGAVISLAAYEGGLLLKKKFRLAVLNPLLIGTVCRFLSTGRSACSGRT